LRIARTGVDKSQVADFVEEIQSSAYNER